MSEPWKDCWIGLIDASGVEVSDRVRVELEGFPASNKEAVSLTASAHSARLAVYCADQGDPAVAISDITPVDIGNVLSLQPGNFRLSDFA